MSDQPQARPMGCLGVIGNVIWIVLGGIWIALGFLISAVIFVIFIITIPFAKQCLKLASLSLVPFGRQVVHDPSSNPGISTLGNVLWIVFCGLWTALGFVIAGVLCCITIIGIPFGVQAFKLAGLALWPFGKRVI
jgi:uncharacterized membrane protein YccF (DUF307 family)